MNQKVDSERIVGTLGDSTIRVTDVESLHPGCWLTDAAMSFALEWMSAPPPAQNILPPRVTLLPPSVVFMVSNMDFGTANAILEPLHLNQAEVVLLPLNDNNDVRKMGG